MKKGTLKKYIDTDLLEKHYLSSVSQTNEKISLSVETAEKMMLLEIYKALCASDNDNVDDRDKQGKD